MAKILFIDDVPEIRLLYSTVLTKKGHVVIVAASAMQAMQSLKTTEFDYVFVDIKIPDFDGFWFIKESHIEQEHPSTKVIVLSKAVKVLKASNSSPSQS